MHTTCSKDGNSPVCGAVRSFGFNLSTKLDGFSSEPTKKLRLHNKAIKSSLPRKTSTQSGFKMPQIQADPMRCSVPCSHLSWSSAPVPRQALAGREKRTPHRRGTLQSEAPPSLRTEHAAPRTERGDPLLSGTRLHRHSAFTPADSSPVQCRTESGGPGLQLPQECHARKTLAPGPDSRFPTWAVG